MTVLATVAMLVALLAHYADHVLLNSTGFSKRAVSLVQSPTVQSLVVDTVTQRVSSAVGNDPSLRPAIEQAVRGALSDPLIAADIRDTAGSLQSGLVSGNANVLILTLPDVASVIASRVQSISPQLAAEIRAIGTVQVLDVRIPPSAATAVHDLATVGRDSSLLALLAVALGALALILTPDRRRTLMWLGGGACASGLLAAAAYLVGRAVIVGQFSAPDARTAARAAWSIYLGGLESSGLVLAAAGAVIAGAAALFRD